MCADQEKANCYKGRVLMLFSTAFSSNQLFLLMVEKRHFSFVLFCFVFLLPTVAFGDRLSRIADN